MRFSMRFVLFLAVPWTAILAAVVGYLWPRSGAGLTSTSTLAWISLSHWIYEFLRVRRRVDRNY